MLSVTALIVTFPARLGNALMLIVTSSPTENLWIDRVVIVTTLLAIATFEIPTVLFPGATMSRYAQRSCLFMTVEEVFSLKNPPPSAYHFIFHV